jgi:hypothetical protein
VWLTSDCLDRRRTSSGGSFQFGNLRDFPPPSWPRGFGYDLGADEAAAFPEFFSSYRKAAQKSSIEIAERRFAYASDRSRSEDRIIDLMVAAEALSLTDASSAGGPLLSADHVDIGRSSQQAAKNVVVQVLVGEDASGPRTGFHRIGLRRSAHR